MHQQLLKVKATLDASLLSYHTTVADSSETSYCRCFCFAIFKAVAAPGRQRHHSSPKVNTIAQTQRMCEDARSRGSRMDGGNESQCLQRVCLKQGAEQQGESNAASSTRLICRQ
jgi:hypothetical protein